MSDLLTLKLFGNPQVLLDGRPVSGFISAKAQALLFYLAVTARPHSRETLAGLLWGDMPESQASKNLRNALSNLRALVGSHLLIGREEAGFNPEMPVWLDVAVFSEPLAGDLSKQDLTVLHSAVELYQGEFLEGFYVGDALAMEEWIIARRSLLNGLMVQALHTLVARHLEREEYAAGIDYANRLLSIEPWREETHRHLMMMLVRQHQRAAALAQYETCCKILQAELGVEPMAETTALYQRIKSAGAVPPHNLPPQLTPLIGRQAELAEIASYLNKPDAQLLTLVGPGGIGKTRLALQAAARCVDPDANVEPHFSDGVFLVPLAGFTLTNPQQPLMAAVADALRLELKGPVPPQAQLLNYMRDKEMLLILDNFDYLVGEAQPLADILHLAPRVKLLVTSRVRLNLQEEWLLEVKGLEYPRTTNLNGEEALRFSAVCLFIQQGQRMRGGLTLSDADAREVIRICQLVEGNPLGIELAASWLRMLTPEEICSEIDKSVDFLTTSLQNVPERHRSVRAVFEYSWNLLSPAEQSAFRQLSVFRGGFQREAAAQIVMVQLPLLAGLVDKSLLTRNANGRYQIHDMLRQYGEEKLRADPFEHEKVHDAHCRYFAQLIACHKSELKSQDQSAALSVLDVERENMRAAWNWAVSQRRVQELNLFMDCI